MTVIPETIMRNFRTAYPDEFILVYKFKLPGEHGHFHGIELLNVNLGSDEMVENL